jgi:hypothetical protein
MAKPLNFFKNVEEVSNAYHDLIINIMRAKGDKAQVREWRKLKVDAIKNLRKNK